MVNSLIINAFGPLFPIDGRNVEFVLLENFSRSAQYHIVLFPFRVLLFTLSYARVINNIGPVNKVRHCFQCFYEGAWCRCSWKPIHAKWLIL